MVKFSSTITTSQLRGAYNDVEAVAIPTPQPPAPVAVQIQDVSKSFGSHIAVDSLSLQVPRGCIYGFIGPNGSGKTTTLRMIMKIIHPDTGSIQVLGEDRTKAYTDRIGYLPEERGLYRKMKLRPMLQFFGEMKCGRDVKAEVDEWLERFDMGKWADKKVEALSKGMGQKIQFISAVISKPELMILDEPFTGLDPVNADVIRDAVLDLQRNGSTVIFSTHDMSAAEELCDFIFMIYKGKKVLDGTLEEIQGQFGSDTIRLKLDGDSTPLSNISGVADVGSHGKFHELHLQPNTDTQKVLADVMAQRKVTHFELAKPTLHDIFVRIAGADHE
ncbi:MAG: ATP-binding cassette domain-containing protein [Planctomycetes bacterium]|nr:ATP-binding cassette domain-containing protein [Planctomycetota bacterium]